MNFLILSVLIALPFARIAHATCIFEDKVLTARTAQADTSCTVGEPLVLREKMQRYPGLRGGMWLKVEYWSGAWSKTYTITSTYKRRLIDQCSRHPQIIVDDTIQETSTGHQWSAVVNPNLDESLNQSFMLSPMTSAEAQAAFSSAEQDCLAAQPPSSGGS